jgi:uncharacterized protein YecE (DUF72 family)
MTFYIGSAVWAHKGWVGNFLPKGTKEFLREYSRRLTAVEGNTTFYATPSIETVEQWRETTPAYFRFCPKLPRSISHAGQLMPHLNEAKKFIDLMQRLGTRLGPMFLQLPPRYSPKLINDLKKFLDAWSRTVGARGRAPQLAVEVRHLDWFSEPFHAELNKLLHEHNVAKVLIDTRPIRDLPMDRNADSLAPEALRSGVSRQIEQAQERKPDVPLLPDRTASFAFVRYIGHPQIELNATLLDEWADRFAGWLKEGADIFAFCHCPDETQSPQICRELQQRVAARIKIDPLPWDDVSRGDISTYQQGSLF